MACGIFSMSLIDKMETLTSLRIWNTWLTYPIKVKVCSCQAFIQSSAKIAFSSTSEYDVTSWAFTLKCSFLKIRNPKEKRRKLQSIAMINACELFSFQCFDENRVPWTIIKSLYKSSKDFVSNSSWASHWMSGNWFSWRMLLYFLADSSLERKFSSQPRVSLVIGGKARTMFLICQNNRAIHWLEWFWKSWPIRRGVIPNNPWW